MDIHGDSPFCILFSSGKVLRGNNKTDQALLTSDDELKEWPDLGDGGERPNEGFPGEKTTDLSA